jgi:hypothetical protein
MGIAIGNARLLTLVNRKNDIEYRMMTLSNRRQTLAYQTSAIAQKLASADLNQNLSQAYEAQMASVQQNDKVMELEQKNLETQQKAVTTEYESIQKLLENNVKREFKVFG